MYKARCDREAARYVLSSVAVDESKSYAYACAHFYLVRSRASSRLPERALFCFIICVYVYVNTNIYIYIYIEREINIDR